jgi:hypothetical protein
MDFNFDTGTIFQGLATLDVTTLPPLGSGPANILTISGSGALTVPKGTAAQRPGAAGGTDISGMFRYNTTVNQLEYFDSSSWQQLSFAGGAVSSFQTNLSGLTPSGPTTGAVTLSGTLGATSGGTGATVAPTSGQFLYSSAGTTYAATTLSSFAVTTFSAGTTGLTPNSATSGAITLAGTLVLANGGTNASLTAVAGAPIYSTASAFAVGTAGTSGQAYISGGTGVPTWQTVASTITTSQILAGNGSGAFTANGGTFVGSGSFSGVTLSGTVTNGTDATTKNYVDAAVTGLSWKQAAKGATTASLTATYANGTAGVGATLTNSGAQAAFTVDSVTFAVNDRVLVKNQSTTFQNGIYVVTTVGTGSSNWVLTRATDADTPSELDGAAIYIQQGTSLADTGWTETATVTTIGTDPVVWAQFSGSGAYTAGTGLTLSGNQFSLTTPVSLANGGTNASLTAVNGGIAYSTGTALALSAAGTSGQVLTSAGAAAPTWTTLSGVAVTTISFGTTGLTPNSATSGAVTVAGTLVPGNGGTGATAVPTNGQLLIGNGTNYTVATLGSGTGISTTPGAGTLTINNTGVTSNVATANQTTVSSATGAVTIGLSSTLIAPGSVQVTTSFQTSATNTISAAGATQGTATALTTDYNVVTTVAASTGVVLPTGLAGRNIIIVNRGANTLNVYPAVGGTIDSLATNSPTTLSPNQTLTIESITATQWYTVSNTGVTSGVSTFSAGTTGLTPSAATSGVVTLAGTLVIANGGTNSSTALSGSSIMISNGTSIVQGAAGTTTTVLHGNAAGAPTYAAVSLTADVSGILPLANGGTNANLTAVNGGSVYSTATGFAITAAGTTGQVLVSAGAGAPVWTNTAGILQLYKENPSTPTAPTVAGTNAVAIGSGSSAPGTGALALGDGTSATIFGSKAFANGSFATAGDAQGGLYVLRNITTDGTSTALFLNGATATQRLTVNNNSVWTFDILVTARRTDATGGGAGYRFVGVIRKDGTAGSTTFVGTPSKTIIGETDVSWDAAVTANTTDGDLRVTVSGQAAKTIRWVATVQTAEVTN